jgi:phosphonoacetaldehyde hydrolase
MKRSWRSAREPYALGGVVFDWAGTVIDYGCQAPAEAFVAAFRRHAVELSPAEARGPMGLAKKDHVRVLLAMEPVRQRWRQEHGTTPGEEAVEAVYADVEPMLLDSVRAHTELIPGILELVEELRRRGAKIGSTTGYTRQIMEVLAPEARRQGFQPDALVCPGDVGEGRPAPYMCYLNALRLAAWPLCAMIKVGDTPADIQEGLNAGMWTIGFALSGNEAGLTREQARIAPPETLRRIRKVAVHTLLAAGAHYVVDGPWDCLKAVEDIELRMRAGSLPPR